MDEKNEIYSRQESVLCVYKNDVLQSVVKRNGKPVFYKVEEMNNGDLGDLLNERTSN